MIERTPLREQFFAEVRTDPYAHMIFHLYVKAWALGYEAALKELQLDPPLFSDLEDKAARLVTSDQKESEAKMIIAMAQMGSMLP